MWEENEEEDEELIIPGSEKALSLIDSFASWDLGASVYFSESELEFLFHHFYYYEADGEENALKVIDKGLTVFPLSGFFQICMAKVHMDKDEIDSALENLNKASLLDPYNPELALMLSECYEEKEELEKAYQALLEADEHNAGFNADLQIRMVSLLFEFEKREEAIQKLAVIIENEIDSEDFGSYVAFTFDTEDLIDALEILLEKNPFNHKLWALKGNNYTYLKDWESALNAFEYAFYLNEKNGNYMFMLGVCNKELGYFSGAKKYFGEAAEAGYKKEECVIETAICMNRMGDFLQARFLLQNLLTDQEHIFEVYFEIGFAYLHQGEAGKALPYLEKAADETLSLQAYVLLAEAYYKLDEIDKLVNIFEKSLEICQMDSDFFFCHFFGIFYRLDDIEKMRFIAQYETVENKSETPSLLHMVMQALITKSIGHSKQYQVDMINCFILDPEEVLHILETMDEDLLYDPQIISIKELF